MRRKFLGIIFMVFIIAISSISVYAQAATPSKKASNDFDQLNIIKPLQSERVMDYYNAIDVFDLVFVPTNKSFAPSKLCTIYTFTKKQWESIKKEENFDVSQFEVLKETQNLLFVIKDEKTNPYDEASPDGKKFTDYLAKTVDLFNQLKLTEFKVPRGMINGIHMNYHINLPNIERVFAVKTAVKTGDSEKERINFALDGKTPETIATLKVYDKLAAKPENDRDNKTFNEIIYEFMGYTFVLERPEKNPYNPISIDAHDFDNAYTEIRKAVSQAYVYNQGAVGTAILPKEVNSAKLNVESVLLNELVLLDSAGRPLFPMASMAKALGYKVEWKPETFIFVITKNNRLIATKKVESSYTADNYKDATHIMCSIIGDRTYVDLDFVLNVLDCELRYDGKETLFVRKK